MPQVDDLSRSLVAFDQDASLIVVVEMSEASFRAVLLGERTVLLEPQEAPGKLDQAAPHPSIA
jgi:hypothetical protein